MEENAASGIGLHPLTEVGVLFQTHVKVRLTTPGKQPLVVHQALSGCSMFCVECVYKIEHNQRRENDHTYPRDVFRYHEEKTYKGVHTVFTHSTL